MMRVRQIRVRLDKSDLGESYTTLNAEIRDDTGKVFNLRQDHRRDDLEAFFDEIWRRTGFLLKDAMKEPLKISTAVGHS